MSVGNDAASAVLGQPNFTSPTCNNPVLTSRQQLCHPVGVAVDTSSGRLFVSDGDNNRVLIWPNAQAFTRGQAASVLLGQPNFTINPNCGRTNARSLCDPNDLTVDGNGNLFVADTDSNCVLLYTNPLTSAPIAYRVFGQPNFTTTACSTSASGLCGPHRVRVGRSGHLLVSDSDNNRVLEYSNPLSSSIANFVFGQPNFTSHTPTTSATGLAGPQGIAIDSHGNLYLTDEDNNRVLRYNAH